MGISFGASLIMPHIHTKTPHAGCFIGRHLGDDGWGGGLVHLSQACCCPVRRPFITAWGSGRRASGREVAAEEVEPPGAARVAASAQGDPPRARLATATGRGQGFMGRINGFAVEAMGI